MSRNSASVVIKVCYIFSVLFPYHHTCAPLSNYLFSGNVRAFCLLFSPVSVNKSMISPLSTKPTVCGAPVGVQKVFPTMAPEPLGHHLLQINSKSKQMSIKTTKVALPGSHDCTFLECKLVSLPLSTEPCLHTQ